MQKTIFGYTHDGRAVHRIVLNSGTARCGILTYGGALQFLEVPDRNGDMTDVVLGFDTVEGYQSQDKYIGAIIGRYANRIGDSGFSIHGTKFSLFSNSGPDHLHGGKNGFDKKIWRAEEVPGGVRLTLESPHMEEGYPGNLKADVTYILYGNELAIKFEAVSDRETVCSLTNHAYFNLGGQGSGTIENHLIRLNASRYTPVKDERCIPTGEIARVDGTPMDLRRPVHISQNIEKDFDQLKYGGGFDHNWVIDGQPGELRPAAEAVDPDTGILLAVDTTLPGIQFYTGNHLDGCPPGKGGAVYGNRHAFCLETQFYPDSPNQPDFPSAVLSPGEVWSHTTVMKFGVEK